MKECMDRPDPGERIRTHNTPDPMICGEEREESNEDNHAGQNRHYDSAERLRCAADSEDYETGSG